ncbi:MarR family transcriptional regulator [Nonomuraea ferruginea]
MTPCAQQQLARRLDITELAAAQIVDELVRLGLVARGQDPADRRRYALELTPSAGSASPPSAKPPNTCRRRSCLSWAPRPSTSSASSSPSSSRTP